MRRVRSSSQRWHFSLWLTKHSINLAYAEMYVVLAGIFRKYDLYDSTTKQKTPTMALFDTIRERDVDIDSDFFVSVPKSGIQGVRLLVRE